MSPLLNRWLGRWWVCVALGIVAGVMFGYFVPHAVFDLTEGRTLAPKILDEYYPTWSASDARDLYAALGPTGRHAYQLFYLRLDFWFPVLTLTLFYSSLLSLAFRERPRLRWMNLLPLVMYAADVAENLNHFAMAGSFPELSPARLTLGPVLSLTKYVLITALPLVAAMGFVSRRRGVQRTDS
jgi:hypothetical protein